MTETVELAPWGLPEAEAFLTMCQEAMRPDNADLLERLVTEWQQEGPAHKAKRRPPKLLRREVEWRNLIDADGMDALEKVFKFVQLAVVGVDCDGDPALSVCIAARHLEDTHRQMPMLKVPRAEWNDLRGLARAADLARQNADLSARAAESLERDLAHAFKRDGEFRFPYIVGKLLAACARAEQETEPAGLDRDREALLVGGSVTMPILGDETATVTVEHDRDGVRFLGANRTVGAEDVEPIYSLGFEVSGREVVVRVLESQAKKLKRQLTNLMTIAGMTPGVEHFVKMTVEASAAEPGCLEAWTKECGGGEACASCQFCPWHAYEANRQGEGHCGDCTEQKPPPASR